VPRAQLGQELPASETFLTHKAGQLGSGVALNVLARLLRLTKRRHREELSNGVIEEA
jgi:hypothetical protein